MEQARADFEAYAERASRIRGQGHHERNIVSQLEAAALEFGSPEWRANLLERCEPFEGWHGGSHGHGIQHFFGDVAASLGRIEEARGFYETGKTWAESEVAILEEGQCRLGLANLDAAAGDAASAMAHLDVVRKLFADHGIKLYLDKVIAKKLELQGVTGDAGTSIHSLTTTVTSTRPDLAKGMAPDGTVTILFSDIEGSTVLNVELGDDRWMELLAEHNATIREAITAHNGFEVKTEGDAFMIAFGSARDALRCAQTVQRGFAEPREDGRTLRVRMGLRTGEPVTYGVGW